MAIPPRSKPPRTVRQTYGYAKQDAGRGYTGIKGLNALLAVVSTPLTAPLIAATRLRKGSTNSARGAAKLLADALATVRRTGAAGLVLVRADSAYYGYDIGAMAAEVRPQLWRVRCAVALVAVGLVDRRNGGVRVGEFACQRVGEVPHGSGAVLFGQSAAICRTAVAAAAVFPRCTRTARTASRAAIRMAWG